MQLKRIAMDTAFSVFSQAAEILGVKTPVIFESESRVVDGFGNQAISDAPRIYFSEHSSIGIDDVICVGGEEYLVLSVKKEGGGYLSAELGKTKN